MNEKRKATPAEAPVPILTTREFLASFAAGPRECRQEKLGPLPRVKCRGDRLSEPIYWTGKQWAVTAFGLERRDGTYAIAKDRLWEGEGRHGWYAQMGGKVWCDHADFAQALCEARDIFRDLYPGND
jgi:hypothetical protein